MPYTTGRYGAGHTASRSRELIPTQRGKVQNTLTLWNVEGYPINVTLLDMGRVVGVLHGRVAPDGIYTPD